MLEKKSENNDTSIYTNKLENKQEIKPNRKK